MTTFRSICRHYLPKQILLLGFVLAFIFILSLAINHGVTCAETSGSQVLGERLDSVTRNAQLYTKTTAFDPGEVTLYWTATGDDGGSGRASGYDIRYQRDEDGPIDSDQEWQTAIQVPGEPQPSFPGQTDSLEISGLEYGAGYYFCIRAFDHANNYSARSNSPLVISGDTTGNEYMIGDVNDNGVVNGIDVVYLVAYFKGMNPAPAHIMSADANGDCFINGLDVVYMVQYFKGGPPLIRGNC